jgi:hypothetical protein
MAMSTLVRTLPLNSYAGAEYFGNSDLTIQSLPSSGVVVEVDGLTQATLGEMLTATELARLSSSHVPPSGEEQPWNGSVICFPRNCGGMPIPLCAGVPANAPLTMTDLPSNGSVFLADGRTAVVRGQTILGAQLCGLTFSPAADAIGRISLLRYQSIDQAFTGEVLLLVGPDATVSRGTGDKGARKDDVSMTPITTALLLQAALLSLRPAAAAVDPNDLLPTDPPVPTVVAGAILPSVFKQATMLVVAPPAAAAPALLAQSTPAETDTTASTGPNVDPPDKPVHHHIGSSSPPDFGSLTSAPLSQITAPTIAHTLTPTLPSTQSNVIALLGEGFLVGPFVSASPAQPPAFGTTTHWTNSNGGSWNASANWSAGVPDLTHDAVIDAAGTYVVTSPANVDVSNLIVRAGATLSCGPGAVFTVEGSVVDDGIIEAGAASGASISTVVIKENASGTGSLEISNNAIVEIGGAISGQVANGAFSGVTVSFAGASGELVLDQSTQFHGLIAAASQGTQLTPDNLIDLKDLRFTSSMSASVNYDSTSNISTVDFSNGSANATLQVSGVVQNWTFASDGRGGTIVADPSTTNPIVLENEKQGTPESVWQVSPGQDSTELQGFTTAISTNLGGNVQFKIHNLTGSPNYQIQIYRLGYYGGDGARLVTTLQHTTSVAQPAPVTDPSTGEVDAGNWSVTDSWAVPTSTVSGVYVADVVQGNEVFQIPFVIKDPSSTSDIVFQTSDETWQAYNGWGGADLYGGNGPSTGGISDEGGHGAAFAVSYNRPITTRDSSGVASGPQDTVFGAEYSAIYWLEENGYDVSYISGMDTATDGSLLLNHKIFMDDGHDEYWTDSQVANVQAAANAGVNLAFLSGNEVFWQTQFAPSIDGSNTANRTLVTYKDSHFEQLINPTGQGTGSFEAPTSWGGAGMPSNALTGTFFQVDGANGTAGNGMLGSITIPYGETQLRFWRNTGVASTAPGQTATLASDLLGYEWDSSPDNGFMPVGLVDLSSTTVNSSQAYNTEFGNVDTSGTATHNLVEYRDPASGALVFGAGTVMWSWGLAQQSDPTTFGSPLPPDPNVQQAMVNLFADMGVQPQTLEASLVIATASTDHTPPTSKILGVSNTSPVEGQSITVTGTATDAGGGLIARVDVSTDGGKTWHPATSAVGAVTENWSYTFNAPAPGAYTIESRAVDDSLNLETPAAGVSYTVSPSSALNLFGPSANPATANVSDPGAVEVGFKFTSSTNGEITGIRFYKGPLNTGSHVVDLWSATGTLLATATSTTETANGWQQVNFSSPVTISAGTTYVASYHTSAGEYSDTEYYFDTLQNPTNGSLSGIASGADGVYAYGAGSVFPNNVSIDGDNYWVDVVFDGTAHAVAKPDGGFVVNKDGSISIAAATLLANDSDTGGLSISLASVTNPVNGTVSYDPNTQQVTFVPTAGFSGNASFTYSIADTGGATASAGVSLFVNDPSARTLFSLSSTPSVVSANDPNPVELGVKFTADASGLITGLRFYKGPGNTGPHVADLWSSSGTLLATANFTNESTSGWEQVNFATPVSITAGQTYVAAYHTSGNYSVDTNYFANPVVSGDLTAPAGGNGVYAYGATDTFPTSTYNASNYWVDVVYTRTAGSPVANNDSGFVVGENGSIAIAASALLANDTDPNGLPLSISGVSNPADGTVSYNASTQTVTFVPTTGYNGQASFTYSVTDGQSPASSGTVSLSVTPLAPVAHDDGGFSVDENGSLTIAASALLANDTDPNGLPISFAGVNNPLNGTVSYDANAQTVTFVPTTGYTGAGSFAYSITDADGGGVSSATVSLLVDDPSTESLFSPSASPALVTANDPNPVELGVKFTADSSGLITGLKFYKGPQDTGTHVADLWSSNGTLLATATFSNETASGWQQVNFAAPVAITAGTAYIASYHTGGDYSASAGYFSNPVVSGDLTAAASGNGVFAYGANSTFPTNTFNATNYWVDVVYTKTPQPPVAENDSGFVVDMNGSTTIAASALLANDTDPNGETLSITRVGDPSNGTVSYNAGTQTVTFTPNANYTGAASFGYSIADTGGNTASATASLLVNDPTTDSLFNPTTAPSIANVNDPSPVEVGVKFQATEDGQITGLRFYKGPDNTGPHVADLWSSTGTLLATATFTNETPSGWQQVNFSAPVAVTAGTTYVASYHTDSGDYAADPNLFAGSLTNGPLTAPSSSSSGGNGVYAYGSSSLFPTNSIGSTSYGVDVVFRAQLAGV